MILLKAIVRPNKLDAVKDALLEIGVTGLTVTGIFLIPVAGTYRIRTEEADTL